MHILKTHELHTLKDGFYYESYPNFQKEAQSMGRGDVVDNKVPPPPAPKDYGSLNVQAAPGFKIANLS